MVFDSLDAGTTRETDGKSNEVPTTRATVAGADARRISTGYTHSECRGVTRDLESLFSKR